MDLQTIPVEEVAFYCFLTKIITLRRHSFEQWAWQVLDFT